jgi:hypothetical protein
MIFFHCRNIYRENINPRFPLIIKKLSPPYDPVLPPYFPTVFAQLFRSFFTIIPVPDDHRELERKDQPAESRN